MSVIIFFSANKNNLFCRNDVQAIDFLRRAWDAKRHTIQNAINIAFDLPL